MLSLLLAFAVAAPSSVSELYDELRDLHIFFRLPGLSCQVNDELIPVVGGITDLQYQSALTDLRSIQLSQQNRQFLSAAASRCRAECSCTFLAEAFRNVPAVKDEKWVKSVDEISEKMTDADYQACEKKKPVLCRRGSIQSILKQARDSI